MATRRLHARRTAVAAILLVAVISLAGCGNSSSSGQSGPSSAPHVHFAKTKFLLHAGLASATLSKLVGPLSALQGRLSSRQQLHNGHLNPGAITGANRSVSRVTGLGATSGTTIHDLATASLGQ